MSGTTYGVSLSPVRIDPRVTWPRAPVLPAAARGPEFECRFDQLTLFNDVFWEAGGESILAIGPHMPGRLDPERDIRFSCAGCGKRLPARYLPSRMQLHGDMYRVSRPSCCHVSAIIVAFGGQQVVVAVQPNLSRLLAGRRVLTNRCQNDPIPWLIDWATFHVREFGFDAVVHYDNMSTDYDVEDVRLALSRVPGLEVVIVMSWPFPLEPAHAAVPGAGRFFWQRQLKDRWGDSCRLEHQRRRFLAEAEVVMVSDVDELLCQRSPHASIDSLFADPAVAWVKLGSELVVNTAGPPDRLLRHRDLHWIWDYQGFKTPKYLVKPDRCPDEARWWLHDVSEAPGRDVPPDEFTVAHFIALTTSEGPKAGRATWPAPVPGIHHEDLQVRSTLSRVFSDQDDAAPHVASDNTDPHLLRREASELARLGQDEAALARLNRAMAGDPYHPEQFKFRAELLARLSSESGTR